MSQLSQEQRPKIGFRLARVDSAAARVPSLARPLEASIELSPLAAPQASGLLRADFEPPALPAETAALDGAALTVDEFPEEWVAQSREAVLELEPPAPVAGPVQLAVAPPYIAAGPNSLLGDPQPQPFALVAPAAPEVALPVLRTRIVSGPAPEKPEQPKPEPPKSAATPAPEPAKPEAPKPKISIRPAEPAKSSRRTAAMPARTSAQPVEREVPETKPVSQPSEPKVIPIRRADPAPALTPEKVAAAELDTPTLGMPATGGSPAVKIGIAAVAVLAMAGGGFFFFRGGSPAKPAQAAEQTIDTAIPLAPLGGGGWTSNWGAEAPVNKNKQISLYRPTMATPDYRIELHGQIDRKAMGWIFRAHDPRNYYVMKLEQISPGTDPVVALVKYPVINGKEGTRTQVLINEPATMTTLWRVRTDVKGRKFTTYVQDKPVDVWVDEQISTGGAGLYIDKGERALIKTTNISALR